jgi:hypothetical protein
MNLKVNSSVSNNKNFTLSPFDIAGFGQQCKIEFKLNTFFIREVGHEINHLTGLSSSDLIGRTIYYFLDSVVIKEQLATVYDFFNHSINYLKERNSVQRFANLDFEIRTMQEKAKRLLFQFRIFDSANGDQFVYGRLIDFSHYMLKGLPRIFVLEEDGQVDGKFKVDVNILEKTGIDLSKKEIDVLLLKSKGMRAKEIGLELGISNLSVYSIIRDVKQKTGKELLPLIVDLKNLGIIK